MHLFLSPHLDDVALSCGGRVQQLAARGEEVCVLTIMCGMAPDDNLSPFARAHHVRWGRPEDMAAAHQLRLHEDFCALAILGTQGKYLNWPDAIYRGVGNRHRRWFYTSNATLFADVNPAEAPLVGRLTREIRKLVTTKRNSVIYAPLAVGRHVDHQLVRRAAVRLQEMGFIIVFYEELPYSETAGALAAALSEPAGATWSGELYRLSDEELAARCNSVGCYQSQLSGVFGDTVSYPVHIQNYARQVGAGAGPVERFWKLTGAQGIR